MDIQTTIKEYYKKLAEVYIYGLACTDCPNKNGKCVGHEEFCAKRLQKTMMEMMKDYAEV